jgi:hypothetical protein
MVTSHPEEFSKLSLHNSIFAKIMSRKAKNFHSFFRKSAYSTTRKQRKSLLISCDILSLCNNTCGQYLLRRPNASFIYELSLKRVTILHFLSNFELLSNISYKEISVLW